MNKYNSRENLISKIFFGRTNFFLCCHWVSGWTHQLFNDITSSLGRNVTFRSVILIKLFFRCHREKQRDLNCSDVTVRYRGTLRKDILYAANEILPQIYLLFAKS